jgi:hypothetical protein
VEVINKVIQYNRPDRFPLYPLGDIHIGPVHCHEELLKEKVKEIRDNPNALWLGMGDYADLITPSDFKRWDGAILASWMKGKEDNIGPTQLDRLDEILSPIWDKCIGLIEGGHETSIRKYHHYDVMEELLKRANEKKSPPWDKVPYAGTQCMVRLNFKRGGGESHDYLIHARHGEGSATTSGARALAVLRLAMVFVNAHIIFSAHLHGQESPDIPQRLVLKSGKIKSFETIATMTGAWLRAYMQGIPPCYLERWGKPPSVLGCPRIVIYPDQSEMTLEKSRKIMTL